METFSVVLALCAGNSPVTGEFPTQRPMTRSFGVFSLICDRINGWLNNGKAGDLRRHRAHYDVIVMQYNVAHDFFYRISFLYHVIQNYHQYHTELCDTSFIRLNPSFDVVLMRFEQAILHLRWHIIPYCPLMAHIINLGHCVWCCSNLSTLTLPTHWHLKPLKPYTMISQDQASNILQISVQTLFLKNGSITHKNMRFGNASFFAWDLFYGYNVNHNLTFSIYTP